MELLTLLVIEALEEIINKLTSQHVQLASCTSHVFPEHVSVTIDINSIGVCRLGLAELHFDEVNRCLLDGDESASSRRSRRGKVWKGRT